jgi:diguanylate cyclase (GGDEF)-like protein
MAHTDKLTGLYNRNYLDYLLGYEFHKAKQEKTEFILLMMDIDKFKFFNDNYGHGFGDKVLHQVAQKISENLRKTEFVGRFGGDEFLAILPGIAMKEAEIIAQRILDSLIQLKIDDVFAEISLSIGIAGRLNEKEANEVIEKADLAMYRAKQEGGKRFKTF